MERGEIPRISIIVPVYNAEKYLRQCIESILTQTETNFELLLVNDGSSDRSGKICLEYAAGDSRVRVISQKNAGVSAARNRGIEAAAGNYLVFADADDWVEKDYLKILLKHMKKGGMAACEWVSEGGRFRNKTVTETLTKENAQVSAFSHNGIEGYPFCKMFDKSLIVENGLSFDTEIAMCEDLLFVIRYLSCTSAETVKVKSTQYHYRSNPNGALLTRFSPEGAFDKGMLTEAAALERCYRYTEGKKAKRACEIRSVKAAVATLRTMEAKDYREGALYKKLLKKVRRYCLPYAVSGVGAFSAKISVLLCAIAPGLEYRIFKLSIGTRIKRRRNGVKNDKNKHRSAGI